MSKDINAELEALEKKAALISGAGWVKFPNIGDSFQGTLITRRLAMSPTQQEQIVYTLKNEDGIWNLAFKSNYPIHKEFENAVVGQVIRVVFSSQKPHSKKGFSPIKIYTVVTGPDLIDESLKGWLEENGYELGAALPTLSGISSVEEDEEMGEDEDETPAKTPIAGVARAK